MLARYSAALALVAALVIIAALIQRGPPTSVAHTSDRIAAVSDPGVPEEALRALHEGRYWFAARILHDYLQTVRDTAPETILLVAEAEAGWGAWDRVEALLTGRGWLDEAGGGFGWLLLARSRSARERWAESGEAFGRYLELASVLSDRDRGLTELRRGIALAEAGDATAAAAAFDRAAQLLPRMKDWAAVFAADAAAQVGDTAAVRDRLGGVDRTLVREWGWRIRVRARSAAGDPVGALRAAEAAAESLDAAASRAEAWHSVGTLRLAGGDPIGARAAFRRAMDAAPASRAAVQSARELWALPEATATDRLRMGRVFLRHGDVDRGIRGLDAYLDAGLGDAAERAGVRLEAGRALFNAARYAEAERRLLSLTEGGLPAAVSAEALFLAGRSQYRQGRTTEAKATFLRTGERFPRERAAAEALYLLADLEHDAGNLERAASFYRRVMEMQPTLNQAGLAAMRLGGMRFLAGDYAAAAEVFDAYRRAFPTGRRHAQATYWAALAHARAAQIGSARERFRELRRTDPLSYYGIRAADALDEPFWQLSMNAAPVTGDTILAHVYAGLEPVDLLRAIGRSDLAHFEVGRVRDGFDNRNAHLYALAEALNERGYTLTGIRLGWELFRREGLWNPRLLRIVYPFPFRDVILGEARDRGLDPFLVAGLIRQESMFSTNIVSPAGAVGLMQIMPATGRTLARGAGLEPFTISLLETPDINVHLGAAYMADLLRRFGGDRLVPALAAYNAGSHRVERWRELFPEYDDDELLAERIPFAETREYVKIVQQNARIYRFLYADDVEPRVGQAGSAAQTGGAAADAVR